tara:strand:- start:363 stop:560 length:198 start_codon:yes stop_codon:yes gene_type:complete
MSIVPRIEISLDCTEAEWAEFIRKLENLGDLEAAQKKKRLKNRWSKLDNAVGTMWPIIPDGRGEE